MDAALLAMLMLPVLQPTPVDAVPPRIPAPIELAREVAAENAQGHSDRFYRRLEIHRWGTQALLPCFAVQYLAGTQLAEKGDDASGFAKGAHRVGATCVAALFIKNVYSGIPILAESYRDEDDKGRRFTHVSLMLLATAGFTYTGILADKAEGSPDDRRMHRTMALTSMGVATVGYLTMTDLFR